MNYFGFAVAVLNAAAGVQYAIEGKYAHAVVWVCYAIAAGAYVVAVR